MQKLCESEIVCMLSQVKRNGRIHPSQQRRQRSHNPFLETSQGSARLDRKTGWYSNPSPWTTSEFCGHRPAGTDSLIIKKVAGCRFQEIAIPCDRRGVCTVHLTRDFFSHIVMCRTRVAWHQGLTAQVFVVRVMKSFPSMSHERAFLFPRFTSPSLLSCT